MKKINKLTSKQEEQLVQFRNEYLSYGLSCEPSNRKETEQAISKIYTLMKYNKPIFLWFDGQATCLLAIELLKDLENNLGNNLWNNLRSNLGSNLWDNLGSNLWNNLRNNLRSNLWNNLRSNLERNLRNNLRSNLRSNLERNLERNLESNLESNLRSNLERNLRNNLGSNLWNNLRNNLWDNLRNNLWDNLRSNPWSYLYNCFWGNFELYWVAFYKFPETYIKNDIYKIQDTNLLNLWDTIGKSTSWWWPYKNICICSERPLEIHRKNNVLHKDGGAAFVSRDGWKMWYLNGVNVSKEAAELPSAEIDPNLILTEKNSEVRREIVNKIGIERIFEVIKPISIDTKDDYELLSFPINNNSYRPYLKMINPSLGVYHIEGVHPDCRTVEQALNWRNQTKERPTILT